MLSEVEIGYEAEDDSLCSELNPVGTCCLNCYMRLHRSSVFGDPLCQNYESKVKSHHAYPLKSLFIRWCDREKSLLNFHEQSESSNSLKLKRFRPSSPIFKDASMNVSGDDEFGFTQQDSKMMVMVETKQKSANQSKSFASLSPIASKHSQAEMEVSTPSPLKRKLSKTGMSIEFDNESIFGMNKFSRTGSAPWKLI